MKKSLALLFLAMLAVACGNQRHIKQQLDRADALMIDHPDSALEILNSMDRRALATPEKKARHALLLSQALDKNYIDVDNDSLVDQAVRYYSRRGNDIERAKAHYYYAVVKGNAAESGTAIKALLMAREHVVKTDDDRMKALIYTYLGNLYYEQFCFSDAATAYSEAVDAFKNTGQTFYLLYAMRRKGVSLSLIDKKPEALACLSEAKEIAIQANDVSSLLGIMSSLGGVQMLSDSVTSSSYKHDLFKLYEKYTDGKIPFNHYPTVGYTYFLEKNLDSARWYYHNYYLQCPEITNFNVGILSVMSQIESLSKNDKKALEYKQLYIQYSDSIHAILQQNQASELKEKYEADYLQKEYSTLQLIHRYEIISFALIALIILSGCSVLIASHRRTLRKKNRKIAEYKRYVEEGNEHYAQLTEQYNEIRKNIHVQDEQSQALFALLGNRIRSLQQLLEWASLYEKNTDNFYKHFKEHIKVASGKNRELAEDVIAIANISCHGIIDYLQNNYPALSLHELCYCGFICLGFSAESIRILYNHTNVYSIYTMRSKIRHKLGLVNQTENLENHILYIMKELGQNIS
ncbi:hypothetical protein [uncultured Alistipes sp.]|uniref:hypothetical protein n=1 Tax=uncultured Alistipes sp. TaxID=538949 RepID=UPI00266FEF5D|nr:hypothetical protein [uncultured Alistipes sp.]